jgi:hypothetical protein
MIEALVVRLNRERLRFFPLAIAGCTLVAWTVSQLLGAGIDRRSAHAHRRGFRSVLHGWSFRRRGSRR